jgi:hypothetical protein
VVSRVDVVRLLLEGVWAEHPESLYLGAYLVATVAPVEETPSTNIEGRHYDSAGAA